MRSSERQQGMIVSGALHFLMLLLAIFGLPSWLQPEPPPEPMAITVELLPISEISNIKPSEKPPAPEKKEEKPPEPEKPKPPTPPVKTQQPPPPPPPKKEEVMPPKPEEKKPEPKKEEPKKEEPKNKPKEEDLEAVLKAVKDTVNKEKAKEDKKEKEKKPDTSSQAQSRSTNYDDSMPMSISEKDAIRSQFAKCWNVPAGAKNAHELSVLLEIEVAADGTVIKVELAAASKARYSGDTFYRAAADSAIRAVRQCSPLKDLPPEKYGTWKSMEINFDPREMLF